MKLQQKGSKQAEKQGSPTIITFAQKYGRQGNGQKNGNEQCLLYYLKRRPSAMFKSQNNLANYSPKQDNAENHYEKT